MEKKLTDYEYCDKLCVRIRLIFRVIIPIISIENTQMKIRN